MKRIEVWSDTNDVRAFPHVIDNSILETEDELRFKQDTPRHDVVVINKSRALIIITLDEIERDCI